MAKHRKLPTKKRCTACGNMFATADAKQVKLYETKHFVWQCPECGEWSGRTLTSLKQYAWLLFSKTVKFSECRLSTFMCQCVTCGKWLKVDDSNLHAGHFLSGRGAGILFDRRAVHCQCMHCNCILHGNPDKYWPYMLEKYGQGVIDEMIRNNNAGGSWTDDKLREVIHECEDMLNDFAAKGLFL